ncbi:hypothetical protein SALBM311S_02488 [Streptomyces alboniger]
MSLPAAGSVPVRATRISRRTVATSPLSRATAPQSRKAGAAAQAASYVSVTGDAGEAGAVSARHTTWMPARGPSSASRATASRTVAPPVSPSTTRTVYGPGKPLASLGSASSSLAQDGRLPVRPPPAGPEPAALSVSAGRVPAPASARWSSSRRRSSSVRAAACSRS